jgi:hypothetical protein
MDKKRLIVSMNNLPEGVIEAIHKKYPFGYTDYVLKISKGDNDFFHAITVDTEDASYLVKVNVKVDSRVDNDEKDPVEEDDIEIDPDDESLAEDPSDLDDLDS